MVLCFPNNEPCTWHFNSHLLGDEDFVSFLLAQITYFLETNQSPDTSYCNLWELMKASLRGQIRSYSASMNKRRLARLNKLISLIKDVDRRNSEASHADLCRERIGLLAEFDTLSSGTAEELNLKSCQEFLQAWGMGRLLCHQLRQSTENRFILEINTPYGKTTDQKGINEQFRKFYEDLYTTENC